MVGKRDGYGACRFPHGSIRGELPWLRKGLSNGSFEKENGRVCRLSSNEKDPVYKGGILRDILFMVCSVDYNNTFEF